MERPGKRRERGGDMVMSRIVMEACCNRTYEITRQFCTVEMR